MTVLVGVVIASILAQTAPKAVSNRVDIPIQGVSISDDDGGRPAAITPAQLKRWVDLANLIYTPAGIHFLYETSNGIGDRKSTRLNNFTGNSDPDWRQSRRLGNQIAAEHPGKLTLLFRHGPGPNPTGGAFSWVDDDYIIMPGFDAAIACGKQQIDQLAHEAGHYLGLSHTFGRQFVTVAEADAWLKEHKGDLSCFEGDGLSDTMPDPFIHALACDRASSVVLQGRRIVFDRQNLMGYWNCPHNKTISRQQIETLRWFARRRSQSNMLLSANLSWRSPLEAESLKITERHVAGTRSQHMEAFSADNWSGETQLWVGGGPGDSVTIALPVEKAGHYQLSAYLTMAPDFGKIEITLDGERLGDTIDLYAPKVIASGRVKLTARSLKAGQHTIQIKITGKNQVSTGTAFGIDCFEIVADGGDAKPLKTR